MINGVIHKVSDPRKNDKHLRVIHTYGSLVDHVRVDHGGSPVHHFPVIHTKVVRTRQCSTLQRAAF